MHCGVAKANLDVVELVLQALDAIPHPCEGTAANLNRFWSSRRPKSNDGSTSSASKTVLGSELGEETTHHCDDLVVEGGFRVVALAIEPVDPDRTGDRPDMFVELVG